MLMSGLGAPGADGDRQSDASDVGRRARCDLRASAGVLEHILRDDAQVERPARGRHLDELGRRSVADDDLVAGGLLELGDDLVQGGGYAAARQDLEFRSLHGGHPRQNQHRSKHESDRKISHDIPDRGTPAAAPP